MHMHGVCYLNTSYRSYDVAILEFDTLTRSLGKIDAAGRPGLALWPLLRYTSYTETSNGMNDLAQKYVGLNVNVTVVSRKGTQSKTQNAQRHPEDIVQTEQTMSGSREILP